MGIDFIVDYDCDPKRSLSLPGLMGRLKGRDRAEAIVQLYRESGDERPPARMGFEMVRRQADGTEEREIIVVQDLLDAADELIPWQSYCTACPANWAGQSFGCVGTINYPISAAAERWLLEQLPSHEHLLPLFLLKKAMQDFDYSGQTAGALRLQEGVFFESDTGFERDLDGISVSSDQVFEMLFLSGPILPAHGSMLLQFFGGVSQDLDADVIMQLAVPPSLDWLNQQAPFLHAPTRSDDQSVLAFKRFFHAMYAAWRIGARLLLDV